MVRRPTSPPPHRWICAHGRRRSHSLSARHLLNLGDLCTPTSDAPDDQRCSIWSSRRAVRTSNSPPISWPRLAGASFSAFAVGTVLQDQVSCAISPVVQSLRPSPVLPFVLEPLRVTRCQSICANAADQPAFLPKLDVSACTQPLGPRLSGKNHSTNHAFHNLGWWWRKISRALLDYCALHSKLSLFVFISSHRHQIIDLVFCLLCFAVPSDCPDTAEELLRYCTRPFCLTHASCPLWTW